MRRDALPRPVRKEQWVSEWLYLAASDAGGGSSRAESPNDGTVAALSVRANFAEKFKVNRYKFQRYGGSIQFTQHTAA